MSLRHVAMFLEAAEERRFRDFELAYYSAWHAGFFSQPHKKFPPFEKSRPKRSTQASKPQREPQAWKAQKQMAQALNALFGGSFETRKNP